MAYSNPVIQGLVVSGCLTNNNMSSTGLSSLAGNTGEPPDPATTGAALSQMISSEARLINTLIKARWTNNEESL